MAALCPLSLTPLMDEDGVPIVGARIRFYDAGTTTPRSAYQDGALMTAYDPSDIRTGASGRIPPIWIDGGPYRIVITKPAGSILEEIDDIPVNTSGDDGAPSARSDLETGDVIWSYRTGPRAGYVIPNGLTIGSATSGATGRANADCEALFRHLWNADPTLDVLGGRGESAEFDWAAGKTIATPRLQGRALFGLEAMGGAAASAFTGVTFGSGNGATLGARGGAGTFALSREELPDFTLSGSTSEVGDHSHTGQTGEAGAFTPTGSVTVSYPAHSYSYPNTGSIIGGPGAVGLGTGIASFSTAPTVAPGNGTFWLAGTPVAAHLHTFTTAGAGRHAHTFTTDKVGSGTAHQNMPPFVLGTYYQRL